MTQFPRTMRVSTRTILDLAKVRGQWVENCGATEEWFGLRIYEKMELLGERLALFIRRGSLSPDEDRTMARGGMDAAFAQLDLLMRAGCAAGLSDAELLERIGSSDRGIAGVAFEVLIRRHGPTVLATCRATLRNEHDAEDAFQTTFLVLASRMRLLRNGGSLGPWLHRVAVRASERARAQAARRRIREMQSVVREASFRRGPEGDVERDELKRVIHHELERLPERYRKVLVLCDLQSKSYEQAAAALRVPVGTIRSRLSRGREGLRRRMVRRGVTVTAGILAGTCTVAQASAGISAVLVSETTRLAVLSASGALVAQAIPRAARAGAIASLLRMQGVAKAVLATTLVGGFIGLTVGGPASRRSAVTRESRAAQNSQEPASRGNPASRAPAENGDQTQRQSGPVAGGKLAFDKPETRRSVGELLEEARRRAGDLSDSRSKAQMLRAVGTIYAKVGDQEAARTVFQQAIDVAVTIDDREMRVHTLEDIAAGQIESNARDAGLATIRRGFELTQTIGDEHQRNNTRMYIVRTLARAGDLDAALRTARDLPPTMYRRRAIAYAFGGLKQSIGPGALLFMPSFLKMAEELGDPGSEAECMAFLAEALTDPADVGVLMTLADRVESLGAGNGAQAGGRESVLDSQARVLTALAKAQAKAGSSEAAAATWRKTESLLSGLAVGSESLRSERMSQVACNLADSGDVTGALRLADAIVYEYPKAHTLAHIARFQAEAGHRDAARELFARAVQTAHEIKIRGTRADRPNSFYLNSSECLRTVAYIQGLAGFCTEALQTAAAISESKRKNDAMAMIAGCMAHQGQPKQAFQLADQIDDERSKSFALQRVGEGLAESGDIRGALEWARNRASSKARADALFGIVRVIAKP